MIVGGNYFRASIVVVVKFLVFCSFESNPGPFHMGLVTGVSPISGAECQGIYGKFSSGPR